MRKEDRVEVSIWKGRIHVRLFYYQWRDFFIPALRWVDVDDVIEYIQDLYVDAPPEAERVGRGVEKYEDLIRRKVRKAVKDYYGSDYFQRVKQI